MTDALPSGISIYESLNTLVGAYKVEPYAKTAPDKLQRYLRTHLPGWEVAGIRTFHHCPAVWYRNIETGQLVMAMAGTTPLKWKNLLKPALWHNWGRNITNEYSGLVRTLTPNTPTSISPKERAELGRFKKFVEKAVKDFGPWNHTSAHSKAGFEVSNMDLDGSVLLVNPHPPHGKKGFNERTFVVRNSDDPLTTLIPRHRDPMQGLGRGGHGVQGAKESIRGIWKEDRWEDHFPTREKKSSKQSNTSSPTPFPKSEYPEPKYRTKSDLYKAYYKQATHESYLKFKNKALEEIKLKTKNPYKIAKKLKRVFDKGHPVDKEVREKIKSEAYRSVPQNNEYQFQLALHNKKAEVDRQISLGNLKLVDQVRSTTGHSKTPTQPQKNVVFGCDKNRSSRNRSSNYQQEQEHHVESKTPIQRLPKSLKDRALVEKLPKALKDRVGVQTWPMQVKDRVPAINLSKPAQGKPSIDSGPKPKTDASFISGVSSSLTRTTVTPPAGQNVMVGSRCPSHLRSSKQSSARTVIGTLLTSNLVNAALDTVTSSSSKSVSKQFQQNLQGSGKQVVVSLGSQLLETASGLPTGSLSLLIEGVSMVKTLREGVSSADQKIADDEVMRILAKKEGNNLNRIYGSRPLKTVQRRPISKIEIASQINKEVEDAQRKQRSCYDECIVL